MLIRLVPLILAFVLPAVAYAEGWPRKITDALGEVTIAEPPQHIVSTSPSLTGILLAIDAPLAATASALIGPLTDDKGFFLQWAAVADQRGVEVLYPNLDFDIEALMLQEPDLVVASSTGGDNILPYLEQLRAQNVPVVVLDYANDGWEDLARTLGRATGHEKDAARVTGDFARQAAETRAGLVLPAGDASIVSYNFAGTYAVSTPDSPQARVLRALGFSIAGLPQVMRGEVSRSADFDFVSHENLSAAIAGDSVFLLNGTERTVQEFIADPVLANLPAVREGRVYPLGPHSFRVDYYSALQIIETVAPYFRK
ncbi:Fe2+-enterobactin ABC transporter substrate-binding protein [uncultured Paracoccus sp.]|uniref:Fe2+-enterobactin ABC transporter substrate-binding protein n=1 Tax=uncultured Paracoccus sp. TaxID=189685 RepID=UPI00259AA325|nr:Fe2+-enterobactin ABC transporter substrate-binding protein [uncultured Paracoccus sp.]